MSVSEKRDLPAPSRCVGARLRELRRARGLSIRDLATQLEVSPATVSAIENGHTAVTVDRLTTIAARLQVSAIDLIEPGPSTELASGPPTKLATADTAGRHDGSAPWRVFPDVEVDMVMGSAIACFVAKGYHGSNMRSIAAGAGISVAGVYHHYASKQQLLIKILDLTMDELDWRLASARDSIDDNEAPRAPLARLAALVEALALFHTLRPDLAFIGASEMRSLEPAARQRITVRRTTIQRLLDIEINEAAARGLTHTTRPLECARAIATMCTSLPQWFDTSGPTTPEQIAVEYAEMALRMIDADVPQPRMEPHP